MTSFAKRRHQAYDDEYKETECEVHGTNFVKTTHKNHDGDADIPDCIRCAAAMRSISPEAKEAIKRRDEITRAHKK